MPFNMPNSNQNKGRWHPRRKFSRYPSTNFGLTVSCPQSHHVTLRQVAITLFPSNAFAPHLHTIQATCHTIRYNLQGSNGAFQNANISNSQCNNKQSPSRSSQTRHTSTISDLSNSNTHHISQLSPWTRRLRRENPRTLHKLSWHRTGFSKHSFLHSHSWLRKNLI